MSTSDLERSAQRARSKVRKSAMMLRADSMLTLTWQENMQDINEAWRCWRRFKRWLGCQPWGRDYIIVHELQERGAVHFHVALKSGEHWISYPRLIREWRKAIGGIGSAQFERFHKLRERQKVGRIASYISKYITKDMGQGEMNRKRYEVSRGIDEPVSLVVYLPVSMDVESWLSRLLWEMSGRPPAFGWVGEGIVHYRSFG